VYPELVVVHVDAHSDLRDHYQGSFINHATVMRRVAEVVGEGRLIQLGVRSGTKDEFTWMRESGTILRWNMNSPRILLDRLGDRPVYLSLDLDVLDPSCFPGTGNPEPGGWVYDDLERLFWTLDRVNLVAADVVELNPGLDPSDVSSITTARIVRELLLILAESGRRRGVNPRGRT
jgi:agmatinase